MHIDERYLPEELFAISDLIEKHTSGQITPEEQQRLQEWISRSPENEALFNKLTNPHETAAQLNRYEESVQRMEQAAASMQQRLFPQKRRSRYIMLYRLAAACIVALVAVMLFYWFNRDQQHPAGNEVVEAPQAPVPPGQTKARLVLADGSTVLLDPNQSGQLAVQGNAEITNNHGQVVYKAAAETAPGELLYNSIITEKGEMYVTVLSDRTKVYLNARSSLRFPVSFTGKERRVELQGEGYFEVAHDESKPFRVVVNGKTIEVLGTRFAVNAYADEPILKTSLLAGKIKITDGETSRILTPGQQARIGQNGQFDVINDARVNEEISWIRGSFYFNNESLRVVLRQLARWYVVDVEYHGTVPDEIFAGYISREIPLQEVLANMEEMAPVRLVVKDKTIHVFAK